MMPVVAANAASGKAKGGAATSVWEEFVAGTDPTNVQSVFTTKIEMRDGLPFVSWSPDLNTNAIQRTYKVCGRESLDDESVCLNFPIRDNLSRVLPPGAVAWSLHVVCSVEKNPRREENKP